MTGRDKVCLVFMSTIKITIMQLIKSIYFFFFLILCNTADAQVRDDIVDRNLLQDRQILEYQPLREADIFWEKRIWRVVDFREKMNQPFAYPDAPFFNIIKDAALQGDITLYSTEDDKFSFPLTEMDIEGILFKSDTISIFNPDTYIEEIKVVQTDINWEDVKRIRIKEQWFFDENTSTLQVRILGIAPMINVNDDLGNFRYEKPLFWAYYPEMRPIFARKKVFNSLNDAALTSWDDLFERRFFASYIFKQSNVRDERLQSLYSGVDLLLEADKIKQEIFNFEHDLWSY